MNLIIGYFTKYLTAGLVGLLAMMSVYAFYQKSLYEGSVQRLEAFKQQVHDKAVIQEAINATKLANTEKSLRLVIAQRDKDIASLNLDRSKLTTDLKGLYANKTLNDYRINSFTDRLQIDSTSNSNLPITATDTERLAECRTERDATDTRLSNIEKACAITTSDFNLARGWIDSVCANFSCQ